MVEYIAHLTFFDLQKLHARANLYLGRLEGVLAVLDAIDDGIPVRYY